MQICNTKNLFHLCATFHDAKMKAHILPFFLALSELLSLFGQSEVRPLGIKSKQILDSQIRASSEVHNWRAYDARKDGQRAWVPSVLDNAWIQVDFLTVVRVKKILTQGRPDRDHWVERYYVSYVGDGSDFQNVTDSDGKLKEFTGNVDRNSPVENSFATSLLSRLLRIHLLAYHIQPALRLEVYGWHEACFRAKHLGVSNHEIVSDSQMFAGTDLRPNFIARSGRLNFSKAWAAESNEHVDHWLGVDFLNFVKISSILTQGSRRFTTDYWTKSYKVSSSTDGINYEFYKELGNVKNFSGNSDANTVVENYFSSVIFARFVRVHALSSKGMTKMRVDYKGCQSMESRTACVDPVPLGMRDRVILDRQLSASSSKQTGQPKNGRYGFNKTSNEDGGWMSASWDEEPWFMVDFLSNVTLTDIQLDKPDMDPDNYVVKYEIDYGSDGVAFERYEDANNKKAILRGFKRFYPPILARFVRVHMTTCKGTCGMRAEFYGCHQAPTSPQPLGMEDKTILDSQITASSESNYQSAAQFARLHVQKTSFTTGSWLGLDHVEPWLQVDFVKYAKITAIETQGNAGEPKYTKTYTVFYSNDEENFRAYEEFGVKKVFLANVDRKTVVRVKLSNTILAKYIRIYPVTWESNPALRVEFIGAYVDTNDCKDTEALGMSNSLISDDQISASSEKDNVRLARSARLYDQTGWMPHDSDQKPWLQIDLLIITKLTMIETQGQNTLAPNGRLVKNYTLAYTIKAGTNFTNYEDESGNVKSFKGNNHTNVTVKHYLYPRIIARILRLNIGKCAFTGCCMRIELFGCYEECPKPQKMGLENGGIKDDQIRVSSKKSSESAARYGRLSTKAVLGVNIGGWMPKIKEGSYFIVDFLNKLKITGVITQGRNGHNNWMKTFKLRFSVAHGSLHWFQESGKPKIFTANRDRETRVIQTLARPILARLVAIHPQTWHLDLALRAEFLGCFIDPLDQCLSSPCQNGICEDGFLNFTCICTPGFTGQLCEIDCVAPVPLGMSNGHISDSQIIESTAKSRETPGRLARLNNTNTYYSGAWTADHMDANKWLQVDFLMSTVVTMVVTQGRSDGNFWVTTYVLSYSDDGHLFRNYTESGIRKIFTGNTDRMTPKNNTLSTPIVTRFMRIYPLSANQKYSLRAEFYGCYLVSVSDCSHPRPLGMENGYIKDRQLTASSHTFSSPCCSAARARPEIEVIVLRDSWLAGAQDTEPWLRVNFIANTSVSGIMTQGSRHLDAWVINYTLSYSTDGEIFQDYLENNETKIFEGNSDTQSIVTHTLTPVMVLKSIRINPNAYDKNCALRVEFLGCYKDIDACQSQPCQHGSTCHEYFDVYNTFNCTCADGYKGERCEIDIDDCLSYPCQHGGSCSDSVNAITCTCINGYRGELCEIDPIPCHSEPCQNNATCNNTDGGFNCTCALGYYGDLCSERDHCIPNPCLNNATCSRNSTDFKCSCSDGYYGDVCDLRDWCYPEPCMHNGVCSFNETAYHCACERNYIGRQCETENHLPITDLVMQPIPAHEFGKNISIKWSVSEGTYLIIEALYNTNPCCNSSVGHVKQGTCICAISDPDLYDPDGVVEITVIARNLVSSPNTTLEVEVLKKIQNVSITMHSDFGIGLEGNIFPAEYAVKFDAAYLDGTPTSSQWTINCTESGTSFESALTFEKIWTMTAQDCDILVALRNSISQATARSSVVLKESVILNSLTSNSPMKLNRSMTFVISLQKLGTQTCLWLDLGDNSSLVVFGYHSCPSTINVDQINPNIVIEPRLKFTHKYSDSQEIVIDHVYPRVGSYDVRLYASNDVSMVAEQLVVEVLALECRNPNVSIIGLTPNSSNVLNAVQIHRSVDIMLTNEQAIDCEITDQTTSSWTVYKLEDDPRDPIPLTGLRKSLFHTEISTSDLLIPGRFLPYGFYEIVARVEMRGLRGVFGTAATHIQVIQTPWLEAAVIAGSFHTVPYGFQGSINASVSIDPDFVDLDGMTFAWFCRNVNDSEFLLSNLNVESLITIPDGNDTSFDPAQGFGGCFDTGRGRLNSTDLVLRLDTRTMTEDETYAISLVIATENQEFGPRQDIVNIFFYVARGLPPALSTSCSKNCREKVIPDEKIILKSKCSAYCYGELSFSWSLYMYDDPNMPEPFNLTDLNAFSAEEFQNIASSPINQIDIAIKPNSLEKDRKYIVAFRATRPSGVYGELRYTMLMNSPPSLGNCSFSPLSGIAMHTNFTLSCENWIDLDAPLSYEFSYQSNGVRLPYFYTTAPIGRKVVFTDWLPVGDQKNDFELTVTVQVKDKFGSKTKQDYTVQVLPPSGKQLNMEDMLNMVTGGTSHFEMLLVQGQGQRALSLASSMGTVLAYLSENQKANATSTMYDKEASKKIKLQLLTSISQNDASSVDVSSLEQTSATVVSLVGNTDELTPETKDTALRICGKLTDNLKTLSDEDAGFVNVQRGASNLVRIVGEMSDSAAKDSTENSTEAQNHVPKQIKTSFNLVNKLQTIILDNMVSTEGPVNVETNKLSLQVEKVTIQDLGRKKNSVKNSEFKPPPPEALGLKEIANDRNNTFLQMQPTDIKMAVFDKNPLVWDNTSETISSNVIDVVLTSSMNISSSNFSEDATIKIARDLSQFPPPNSFYLKPNEKNLSSNNKDYLKYHCFHRTSNYTSMNFELHPEEPGIHFKVYLKRGGKPNVKDGDFTHFYEVPDLSNCTVNNEDVFNSRFNASEGNSSDHVNIESKNCLKDPYTVFVSNVDFNGTGEYCFAIQHIRLINDTDENANSQRRRKRSVSCEVGARRVRRSCVIIPPAPPKPTTAPPIKILVADNLGFDGEFFFPNQTPNYNLTMFESSCMHWDVENETWTGEGCTVALGTNKESIVCSCNHLTSFGSDLLVAPNPIDFDSVFTNFGSLAENVAVLALISTILGVYIIGLIWARRADKRDLLMIGPTILPKPKGSYRYLITTYTGSRQSAGTTAKVVFTMTGDDGETPPVRLRDRHRPCFERGQENAFVVSYPRGIGDLTYLQIWHDNSGASPSWYLSRISVKDLQTGKIWSLFCENWLAVESQDGKVCRVLSVANEQEMVRFGHLFSSRAIKGLADGHIWFSIVSRPPTSSFTRVQRLSCALCLLCCTMITSAMFYNMGGQGPSPFAVHIGSLVIDLKPFVIGLQSSIIIVPVNVLIVQIFRNLRPKATKVKLESSEDNVVEAKRTKEKKLPHWFIFVAYGICYLASAASIFFTLLYSIQWGKETSTEWVIAMVTSFLQSALLLQPIKVVLAAAVFAFFIKNEKGSQEEEHDEGLVIRNPCAKKKLTARNLAELEKTMKRKRRKSYYSPPDPSTLQEARKKRLKELKSNAALKEIFAFFVFLILLMDVAQYHRTPDTFLMTKTLYETFEEVDAYGLDLTTVSDPDSLWMWSRETLIPGLYGTEMYNGKKMQKGWLANTEDYLVGVPRVRLLRVEEDSCTISDYFKDSIPHCYSGYSVSSEEDGSHAVGWGPLPDGNSRKRRDITAAETEVQWSKRLFDSSEEEQDHGGSRYKRGLDPIMAASSGRKRRKKKRLLASSKPRVYTVNDNALLPNGKVLSCMERWDHQTMMDLRGFPYWGTITMYSGSGYVANLGYDPVAAYTVVADLHSNGWLDVQTRAVFVEFTVFNANTNLFGIVSYFIEFPPSSAAITTTQYQVARFYLHLNGGQTLAHVMVIFFMLYFLYREGKLIYKQRWAYFKGFWNWVEVILVICEFLLIILFLARLYEVDRNLLQLRENPNDYVGFQYAANADALMTCVLGVLVFFYILRFLRLLRFNKNFLVIGKTLSRISAPILSFCLPFIAGFLAFASLAFAMFGSELEDYSSFIRTLVTQFSMTLGDFDFEAIFMVNPTIATLYFFSFIGLNVMVLMNMFIAIINDSYAEIQEETAEIQNELEIIDYVTENITRGFNETFRRGKVAPVKKMRRKQEHKPKMKPVYVELDAYTELNVRANRLDLLTEMMEESIGEDKTEEERFCMVPQDKRQDRYFRVLCLMEDVLNYDDDADAISDSKFSESGRDENINVVAQSWEDETEALAME